MTVATARQKECGGSSHDGSRPFGRVTGFALSLTRQPGVYVADEVMELSADMDGAWPATTAEAPVVEGPDR